MSNGSNPAMSSGTTRPPIASDSAATNSQGRVANMSRAERFEDEKRRIIESCFSKYDQNNQLAESYITHIRVQEDGHYPSTPSPPDSPQENKKPRLIIIAVRSTGRVRMHKARENNNGSFSIGKTWNLEELTAIEAFSGPEPPQNEKEAQHRAWAGSIGFTVTITKPYYWQAGTAKEKEFFIASAVKIYRKYTKGQVPELKGFDEAQRNAMMGIAPGQQPPPQGPPALGTMPAREDTESPQPPQPPFAQRPQSRDDSRYRGSPGPPGSMSGGSTAASRHESPARFAPPPSPGMPPGVPKPFASQEHLRSNSRDSGRSHDSRPGTSPGPGGYARSPPPAMPPMPRAPSQQSSHSQLRSTSATNLSFTSERDPPRSQFRPQSPPRKAVNQSMDSIAGEQNRTRSPPNGSMGTSMFPPPQTRPPERSREISPSGAPQLPPIETGPLPETRGHRSLKSADRAADRAPKTAESDVSSPGMDAGDAAAFAAVPDFLGPEHSFASPPMSSNEPSSPPTPEKSKNRALQRPPLESTQSDSNIDLRPPPLNQAKDTQRSMTPDGGSTYVTPRDGSTPAIEEPPVIKPLSPLASPPEITAEPTKEVPKEEPSQTQEEEYRPGLGPMIKKKAVADRFRKAANTAGAFRPRAGGAAEKIMAAKAQREGNNEPDGITGVVPAPKPKPVETPKEEAPQKPVEDLAVKKVIPEQPPKVEISSPTTPSFNQLTFGAMDGARGVELQDETAHLQTPEQEAQQVKEEQERIEQRKIRQPQVKVKRRSAQQEQLVAELGIDRSLVADKCIDFELMLLDFGWNDASLSPKAIAELEANLRREQSRLEAGSWLSSSSHETSLREDREKQVFNLLDKAIQECDEMDGLLTIYNVELNSLNEDIAYIEAQSQGLQVQAANQRLLHTELKNLVQTISLDKRALEQLRHADLSNLRSLDEAETCLLKLYQALVTIDPNIRSTSSGRPKSRGGMNEGNELASMAAVRQKRDIYSQESDRFCQRLMQHMEAQFTSSFNSVKGKLLVAATGNAGAMTLNMDAYPEARRDLWVYSPLILFTKELNMPAWQTILRMYHSRAKLLYADAFGQNVAYWKRSLRKPSGDEADILFTTQEKDEGAAGSGALSSARKLTVKRSQTRAARLRSASGEKNNPSDSRNTGSLSHCEIFNGAMDEMGLLVSYEQNFVVDLFHATSLETADFMDVVTNTPPRERYGTNVAQQKPLEPDREMARTVTSTMSEIFSSFTNEMSSLMDWSISTDPIQGVGVMACLSKHHYHLQESSQEFLVQLIESLRARLENMFAKFVEEQVRAIEDTKVKFKKRKGVIGFMKVFPHFALGVENTFASVGRQDYDREADSLADVRKRLDDAYSRINQAMFDSLKVIAKEGPSAAPHPSRTGTEDPEDKELLNYHVMIIENMNHYITEVDDGGKEGVLAEWKGKAEMERKEAMDAYIGQVIRRPLGKILVRIIIHINGVINTDMHNRTSLTPSTQ
jgi:exocyst complex component 1